MTFDRLWAGWRSAFVAGKAEASNVPVDADGTLFERILTASNDEEAGIIYRGDLVSVLLNAYPYGSGHMLVVPNRGLSKLSDLTAAESHELWETVQHAANVAEAAYSPPGLNVGLNQGYAGGASVPDHLHVHVLPRWTGDTNFMTSIAETRVLPEPLSESWQRLRDHW